MLCRRRSEVDTRAAFEREWPPESRGGRVGGSLGALGLNGRQRGATPLSVRSELLGRANGRRVRALLLDGSEQAARPHHPQIMVLSFRRKANYGDAATFAVKSL